MANGVNTLANLQGKVDATNALVVVGQAASGTPTATAPVANLQGKVDANNALVVVFV